MAYVLRSTPFKKDAEGNTVFYLWSRKKGYILPATIAYAFQAYYWLAYSFLFFGFLIALKTESDCIFLFLGIALIFQFLTYYKVRNYPVSHEKQQFSESLASTDIFHPSVEKPASKKLLGVCGFVVIQTQALLVAVVSYYIAQEYIGRGMAPAMIVCMVASIVFLLATVGLLKCIFSRKSYSKATRQISQSRRG